MLIPIIHTKHITTVDDEYTFPSTSSKAPPPHPPTYSIFEHESRTTCIYRSVNFQYSPLLLPPSPSPPTHIHTPIMSSTPRTTIESLPFELLSNILSLAAESNMSDPNCTTYTYGLSCATRSTNQKTTLQKYVRGRVPTDVQRWNAVSAFRHVNSRWHEWALSFAMKELYIRRWRGGET